MMFFVLNCALNPNLNSVETTSNTDFPGQRAISGIVGINCSLAHIVPGAGYEKFRSDGWLFAPS